MYQQPPTQLPPPYGYAQYAQGPPPQTPQGSTGDRGGSSFGTGLIILGVVGTLLVQTLVLLIFFRGSLSTAIQEQEFLVLGCMLTLGAIAVFILPGMFLVYQGIVKS